MAPERSQLSAAAILSTCLSRAAGRRTPTIGSWPVRGRPGFRRRFGIGFLLTQKVAQGRTFFGPRREQIAGGHCGGLRDRRGARELNLVRLALARSCSHTFVAQQGGGLGETSTRAGAAAFPVDPRPRLAGCGKTEQGSRSDSDPFTSGFGYVHGQNEFFRSLLEGIAAPRGGAARAFEQVAMRSTIRSVVECFTIDGVDTRKYGPSRVSLVKRMSLNARRNSQSGRNRMFPTSASQ